MPVLDPGAAGSDTANNGPPATQAREGLHQTPATNPTPEARTTATANMAVEAPELDDFGLPIKKYIPPSAEETDAYIPTNHHPSPKASTNIGKDAKEQPDGTRKAPIASTEKDLKIGNTDDDTDLSSDEEDFKDAVSVPQSDAVSRVDGEENRDTPTALPIVAAPGDAKVPENSDEISQAATRALDTMSGDTKPQTKLEHEEPVKTSEGAESNKQESEHSPKDQDQAAIKTKEAEQKQSKANHSREKSDATVAQGQGAVASEFSHQHLSTKQPEKGDDEDTDWQVMPAYAPYDLYNDDNKLIAKEYTEAEDESYGYAGLGGAGKGYTRVFVDDDAESATSMDENTQYLFKDKGLTTAVTDEDDAQRDAVSQLQATKDLLTEGQRIAYVGLTRLELSAMVKEIDDVKHTKKTKRELGIAAESMRMWSQKMMIRLYAHMDISPAEQIMIEQLSAHGVMPQDLTPLLMANARVKNPMAEEQEKSSSDKATSNKASSNTSSGKSSRPTSVISPDIEEAAEPPPPYEAHETTKLSAPVRTPSQMETSQKINIDLRWTVLCDLFLVLIADSIYDSRSRVLLERVAKDLEIPWVDICRFEKKVTDALEMQQNAEKENWNEDDHMENRRKLALRRRYVMMGLATVGGGLVIGLSAGLLAPVIGAGLAAGFTTIGVTGTTSFLAGAGGAAIITSSAAASGSVIGVRAADRRTGSVKTFEYRPLHNNKRVNLIVTVSGWMTGKVDDVRLPYSTVDPVMGDLYSVLWEPEMLTSMGDTINILATEALTQGLQQVLGSTILVGLMAALQLPVVLTKLSYLIDNPWAVSLDRATMAGLILADSLVDRNLGTRPVTLVGYSLGSRVIFSCLKELAKKGAFGLVQNVYLFGSPVVVSHDEYLRARAVVSGRFVNGYNRNDWILGYLFRLTNGGIRRVAGLAPIEDVPGLENKDVQEFVAGHMDYRRAMPRLLRECGWMVESDEFTEIEDPDPENHQERQRELINEIEEARKELQKDGKATRGGAFSFFRKKKALEKQEWEVYQDMNKNGGANSRTEDKEGNNHGVLFDVDAIRAELAREQENKSGEIDGELLQVREIKSTLPPMKLDLKASPSPSVSPGLPPRVRTPRASLREAISAEVVPYRSSGEYRSENEYRPAHQRKTSIAHQRQPSREIRMSSERTPTFPASKAETDHYNQYSSPKFGNANELDDEVQLTFDTSFEESKPQSQSPPPRPPPKDAPHGFSHSRQPSLVVTPTRPEIKSAQTAPNVSANPWADFDDDEEFGKEKEISMTFA
ncbi:hypothetical protein B0H67DRAFT_44962 [Lasiosphaeris hirsuta]|uniref:DUF726 domain protein n=1 Tax=Lasiosphaeris hirsuta TaxID=260670 RepID=A0AA40BAF3_9PEZI|nr:hypothetical protein B0H67DRAFT_44962 [Lasiosphaeris hirsuta]